jgi:putative ABC transport system permease protein
MFSRLIGESWRSLAASPLFSLIAIASLAIGCCSALLVGANIKQHFSFERWIPEARNIAIMRTGMEGFGFDSEEMGFVGSAIEGIGEKAAGMPGVVAATVLADGPGLGGDTPSDGERGLWAKFTDKDFFRVFDLPFVEGDAQSAFGPPDQIVVTEKAAQRLFGEGPWLGKTIEFGGKLKRTWRIGGVLRDLPATTHFSFEALATLEALRMLTADQAQASGAPGLDFIFNELFGMNYVRFAPGSDPEVVMPAAAEAMQPKLAADRVAEMRAMIPPGVTLPPGAAFGGPTYKITMLPLLDLHFESGRMAVMMHAAADMGMLLALAAAAAALLLVSGFNYVTLALARSLRRQREVAIRKVVGADRRAIARHYLIESVGMTALALAIGYLAAELVHPWFGRVTGQNPRLFDLRDPVFLIAMTAGGVLLALAVGAYPAFYLANVRPRAGLEDSVGAGQGVVSRFVTRGLLGVQIGAATVLLAVALTMMTQAKYIADRPLGYNLTNIHRVQYSCGDMMVLDSAQDRLCRKQVADILATSPEVRQVTRGELPYLTQGNVNTESYARGPGAAEIGKASAISVDTDMMQMVGAKLLAGRFFDSASAFDRQALDRDGGSGYGIQTPRLPVIVSRAMLPMLGVDATMPEGAIGQAFVRRQQRSGGFTDARAGTTYEIIGVVEDWHQRSLRFAVSPIVFKPDIGYSDFIIDMAMEDVAILHARLNKGLADRAASSGIMGFAYVEPAMSAFQFAYQDDQQMMWTVAGFAGVSMLVACLGVYGLSAFDMRRRVREIGIRKAVGASPGSVAAMIIGRQVRFALIASLVAWPVGWWIANGWLSGFVYRTSLGPALLPAASLAILTFLALAIGLSATRGSLMRPGMALRITQ